MKSKFLMALFIMGTTAWSQTEEARFFLKTQGYGHFIGLTDFNSPYSQGGGLMGIGVNLGIELPTKNNWAYNLSIGYQPTELNWHFSDFPLGRNSVNEVNETGPYWINEIQNWGAIRLGMVSQTSKNFRLGWGISYARNLKTTEYPNRVRPYVEYLNIVNEVIHPENFITADVELEFLMLKNFSLAFNLNLGTTGSPKVYTPTKDFAMQAIYFGGGVAFRYYF